MEFRKKVNRIAQDNPIIVAIVLIVLIGLLTYLPGITKLGYYRDDWHVTWGGTFFGAAKIVDLHLTDRPLMGLIYALTFRLLGNNVLVWHIYVLILRILGGITVFFVLNKIWKAYTKINTIIAALFIVYPGFLQITTSSAYSNHLLGLLCGFLAILFTLMAYEAKTPFRRILYLVLSMPLALICFGFMEWMMGIEGILVFLVAVRIMQDTPFQRSWKWLGKVVPWMLPGIVTFTGFYIWRIFFFTSARSVTDVKSLGLSYLSNTTEMLFRLLIEPVKGILNSLVFSWGVPFYQLSSDVPLKIFLGALLFAVLGIFLLYILILFNGKDGNQSDQHSNADLKSMVFLGIFFILFSILPVIIANREIRLTNTFDRYTLLASFGVLLVIVPGAKLLFSPRKYPFFIMSLLAISMMTQLFNTYSFSQFWKVERALWWQLSWRAPDLERDTVILPSLPEEYQLAESYEVWGPANLIYHPDDPLNLSGEIINVQTLPWIRSGDQYGKTIRRVDVSMNFAKSLLVSLPGPDSCLHVYGKESQVVSEYDKPVVNYLVQFSSLDQILSDSPSATVPVNIFGKEPEHGWCYTYQKASLAYQQGDWETIIHLWDNSIANGVEPSDDVELLPFYEAYARSGRYEDATTLGVIIRENKAVAEQFCKMYETKIDQLQEDEYFVVFNICPHLASE